MKILVLILFNSLISCKLIAPRNILTALNCGSNTKQHSFYGFYYQPDQNYTKSLIKDYYLDENSNRVSYTEDVTLFMTQRFYGDNFGYNLYVPHMSKIVVILQFVEMQYSEEGERTFDVQIGDCIVIEDLDIFKKVGQYNALQEYIPLTYDKNSVYFNNQQCLNAYQNSSLIINFVPYGHGDAVINGIILVEGVLEDTDFYDQIKIRQDFDKMYALESYGNSKKKIKQIPKIKIRPGFEHEITYAEIKTPQKPYPPFNLQTIQTALQTPFGVLGIFILSFMIFILISFAFFDPYGQKNKKYQRLRDEKCQSLTPNDCINQIK